MIIAMRGNQIETSKNAVTHMNSKVSDCRLKLEMEV